MIESPEQENPEEKNPRKVVNLAEFAKRQHRQEAENPENITRINAAIGALINGAMTEAKFVAMLHPLHAERAIPLIEKLRECGVTIQEKKGEILKKKKEIEELEKENSALWSNILNALYDVEAE
ncbi:MAG: hypothetical protein Q7R73_04975 [bacterium]|nr:hypothetical protein [bacterium]